MRLPMKSTILLAAFASIAADSPSPRDELEKLRGTWALMAAVRDGRDVPDEEVGRTLLVLDGETFAFPEDSTFGTGPSGTFKVDPARSPKGIDATPSAGPHKGETWLGIYEVDGDFYKVALAAPGKPRPSRFVSEPGSGQLHSVWRRGTTSEKVQGEMARLQGRWTIVSVIANGRETGGNQIRGSSLVIRGDRYTVILDEETLDVTFRIDPSRVPAAIDLTYREEFESRTFRGIYRLEGDIFTICRPMRPGAPRPAALDAPADSGLVLLVMKRQAP
jgi:uncharacterized protein (TIGR03067 family)